MTVRTIPHRDVEIAAEAFGNPEHPPVLLIMGAMASMRWWPEALCKALADRGHYVIRYDNRDTGLSTFYRPGEADYSMEDMADDAIGVLDAFGIGPAHVVGMSMGGRIAQLLAFSHPERVSTLTLISTTAMGVDLSGLPGMSEAYLAHGADGEKVDWTEERQVIDYVVKDMRMIASTRHPHDEAGARAFVEADVARSRNFVSATNHFSIAPREDWSGALARLKAPVMVIHGTSDPLFPVEHGRAIAATAPRSRLVVIEGGGHELHPDDRAEMVDAMHAHFAAGGR